MHGAPCTVTVLLIANSPNSADIALIGLAVMIQVCAFNRTVEKVDRFLENEAKGTKVVGAKSLEDMVSKLKKPRRVMMLVKAGSAVDAFIDKLVPLLEKGDIIIDGGFNGCLIKYLSQNGFLAEANYSILSGSAKVIFYQQSKMESQGLKMVHNGIEYGDMQLICEAYNLMKDVLGMSCDEMSKVFEDWNKGELDSFLIEITKDILAFKDTDGQYLVEKIRDRAGQKGTGKWTAISALDYGMPVTLIGEAVFARCLSAIKDERVEASKQLQGPAATPFTGDKTQFIEDIRQGFMLLREAAKIYNWKLNYGGIALMWRGGCIIRSAFLGNIKAAFEKNPNLTNLLLDDFFKNAIHKCQASWRKVLATAVTVGVPTPAFSTALAFYDGYRSARLPANLIQAQRDYFGAHTYELLSDPGKFVHTNWTGHGGNVSSSTYNA
nr:6-phosphogluconate dehydrogenase, decarboxylating-like [Lytechinus pictus]